jgi:hypothetical protein
MRYERHKIIATLAVAFFFFVLRARAEDSYYVQRTGSTILVPASSITGAATPDENGFRLSVATASPAPQSTGTSSTTLYCTPFASNFMWTYDSSVWTRHTSSEFTLAVGTKTSGKNYDVFCYSNSGTLTLEWSAAWTNDTTRADAIALQDGVWCKSSDHSRRLLGTARTVSTTEIRDAPEARYLDNVSNRLLVCDQVASTDGNTTWTLTQSTYSAMNGGNNAWYVDYVSSLGLDFVYAEAGALCKTDGSGTAYLAIGVDSTTAKATRSIGDWNNTTTLRPVLAKYGGNPGIGKHELATLNGSDSAGRTMTFQSNPGPGALDTSPYGMTYKMMK